tara:strand:+ start:367 stop:810 length:444 start_codon:yes stop_codon:yes gene_type:complete
MGKLAYSWPQVQSGDIISFVYLNKEKRRLRRTVLVIEPKLRNDAKNKSSQFLLHGIQLEISNLPTNPEIKKILETAGNVEIVDEQKKIYRVDFGTGLNTAVYKRLKVLIKRHGLYRTYNYDKVKGTRVMLEDLRLPPSFIKEIKGEN